MIHSRRFFHSSAFALGIVAAATLAGCGSLDSNTGTAPALATLTGSLSLNPQAQEPTGPVRIAVVWRTDTQGQFNVAEDLPVQPVFPSAFEIQFDGPPPAGAMNSGAVFGANTNAGEPTTPTTGFGGEDAGSVPTANPGSSALKPFATPANPNANVQFAYGTVVAYVDKNGNGKLDLVGEGASSYVDQIIAANQEMLVIYLQGPIPADAADAFGRLPTEGYNLVNIPQCDVSIPETPNALCTSNSGPVDAGTCIPMQWFAMNTPYQLTIDSNPEVAELMCESTDDSSSGSAGASSGPPSTVQPAQYPSPCSPDLSCAPDGSYYFFTTCQTVSNGICEGTTSSCTSASYALPSPTPSGWPCPVPSN